MIRIGPSELMLGAALCLCLSLPAVATDAQADESAQAELRIERVALFKNGVGFFVATGPLPQETTRIRIGQLPVPVYGTFWVGYPEGVKVRQLVTALEDVEERRPAQNLGELLRANPGVRVVVRTGTEEDNFVEGVVRKATVSEEPPEPPSPYLMDMRRIAHSYNRSGYYTYGASMVLMDTADGVVALNAASLQRVDFAKDAITDYVAVSLKRPSIRLELEKPASEGRLSLTYLARGITWCPGYRIDISDPQDAVLTGQALVINEVADLDRVALDLVTGFPNIRFSELLSPVAMSQSLADSVNALATGRAAGGGGDRSHAMAQQRAAVTMNEPFSYSFADVPLPAYSTAPEGTVSEDLFLYPVEDFSLRRGETAYVPLFSAKMPYRHIYTWKIEDPLDTEDRYGQQQDRPDGQLAEEVWHSCRLNNPLDMPLTTAPAEFVNRGQFVGQDMCYYTAPGAETTIRINRAMNILADRAEYEVERKRSAASFYGWQYDLVKVRGELKLRSRLDKAVPVEITKELSGEVLEHTPAGEDVTTAKGLKKVNPKHVLTWEIELGAGEEATLSYVYEAYIRS